jgi:hypothetical protein
MTKQNHNGAFAGQGFKKDKAGREWDQLHAARLYDAEKIHGEGLAGYEESPAGYRTEHGRRTFRGGTAFDTVQSEPLRARYEAVRLQAGKLNGRLAIWDPLKAERDRKRKGFTGRPGIIECPRDAALPELDEFMAKYQRALADNDGRVQFSIETRS